MRALEEDVSRLFHLAIEQGCHETIQVIKEWTTKHSCLTSKWTFGYILYAAITTRSPISIVHVILDIPYKHPDRISRVTWTDFIAACAYERTDIVQLFLDEGHLDVKDTRPKICPLILAVRSGFRSIVEKVLAAGAKVHTSYDDGKNKRTAIELAMHKRSPGMVECLLEAGARIPGSTRWPQHEPTYEVLRKARMERHRVSVPDFKERFKMKGKQRTRR
ncbi:hypothetical protein FB567DRAFT_605752 [Paraphoma chrysanthemicola]|uniref:Ankyrin n=1 Tax=Paraphoma chrysanthemicola TaxID=798071 RepID=A0A8K0R247_9PLEO|nr:hypothetical protein FB567DRAFT_605752 [Paraphoma chrysanthemicola]